ncbi:unnamed protein product [Brachionus calyciflorus]|uniref:Interleukin 17 n=1 Tax=Brachionus calyciflorus TaxID=104777 RepID=A0A814EDF5_9BILA|nr:unnamed protein product [Brachionus calyciflorus]
MERLLIMLQALFLIKILLAFDMNNKEYSKNCQDPEEPYLHQLLSSYISLFNMHEQNKLKNPEKVNTLDSDLQFIQKKATTYLVNKSQCNLQTRNSSIVNEASLCPWKTKQFYRKSLYPHVISQVQCTCNICMTLSKLENSIDQRWQYSGHYSCLPVLKKMPVLRRTNVCINGTYKWDLSVEHVGIACVCGVNYRLGHF